MREVTYRKRRKWGGKIAGVLLGLLALAALVIFGLFRVQKLTVTGNSIYSASDIEEAVMQDGLCKNTLYLMWKYQDDSRVEEELPFLSSVEVTMLAPYEVQIKVYEKPEVGYFLNGTDYVYFDQDGLIVEIVKKQRENIPKVTGVNITKPERYQPLPVKGKAAGVKPEDTKKSETEEGETETEAETLSAEELEAEASQETFDAVVSVARLLNRNGLTPKEIRFDEELQITLLFEHMRVKLGDDAEMEEKLATLRSVYEKVQNKEGVLHMEDYSSDSRTITFRQGETEESLEMETESENASATPKGTGEGDAAQGQTESDGGAQDGSDKPVYTEADGTFSTDANGNPIYTDAAGNVTPNVDGYNYTDENGGIITDGYGYIDPYTGAYILNSQ